MQHSFYDSKKFFSGNSNFCKLDFGPIMRTNGTQLNCSSIADLLARALFHAVAFKLVAQRRDRVGLFIEMRNRRDPFE